jgi:SAM-dependent methyltransferase
MQIFHHYLRRELGELRGKSVLDIGCGTGHLFVLFAELSARRVVGMEPAARSAAIARRDFPRLEVIEGRLEETQFVSEFDVAVAVMSFEHQPDLSVAFRKVRDLLKPGGTFLLVTADREFHVAPRFDLPLETYEMPDGSAVVATGYPYGTIHDVVRPLDHYESAARATGFTVLRREALFPTRELIEAEPRWAEFEGRPVAQLLVMRRAEG